jgi:hypothetical protein
MAERAAGHGASWFVIGFLAGVAATLAVLIFGAGRPRSAEATPAPRPAIVTYTPPRIARTRTPVEAPPPASSMAAALTPLVGPAVPDEQVQEDAAAAGMTARRPQPAADLH